MLEHGEAIEADLARFYQLRLADLATGGLSWRRLGSLVRNLPSSSATLRAARGPSAEWSTTDHLLATVVDLLVGANWQRGGGKTSRPKPLERPGSRADGDRIGTAIPLPEMKALAKQWMAGELAEGR